MRAIIYTDKSGYVRRAMIPDTAGDEEAAHGIPAGPPELEQLDWETIKREINNSLAGAELFNWTDVQRSQIGFQGALNILKRHLVMLYREKIN